jgi:hypothetical protein
MNFQRSSLVKLTAAAVLSVAMATSQFAKADDESARQGLAKAQDLFAQRSTTSLKSIDETIAVLKDAEAQAVSKELKYDILILASRALYFQGTHTSGKDNKKRIHGAGQAKAEAAEALSSDYSEAPYYAGINLARWGEANGIVSSVTQVPKLKRFMKDAIDRSTRTDESGETVDGYGPYRTLGRVYKKLPGVLGGSHKEAVSLLGKAVKGEPTYAFNIVFLADSLIKDGNSAEKAEGKAMLEKLLAQDPATLNPAIAAENTDAFQAARDVLAGKEI